MTNNINVSLDINFVILFLASPRLGLPGPRLQKMMDSGDLNASSAGGSMSLNASIRERLRSKVRGRQVIIIKVLIIIIIVAHNPRLVWEVDVHGFHFC